MNLDLYILTFSALTVIATIYMGFWSARKSKTASDFFVAGRSVSVGWNASAISGEYLSAASFMGIAGMVMSSGYDALWYPVCYACGYLFLLLFIAGPLRRFGAYTIPDFAEGRFDSPVFRKIAVVFVLFIGFFYTMPQMKGAGTTLAYIFPGLPYWAGVVLVGAVITLNVALGGMKGITLVQAFQYWAKMFAISVPIFVLMAVYGDYGKQVEQNVALKNSALPPGVEFKAPSAPDEFGVTISESSFSTQIPSTWNWWRRFRGRLNAKLGREQITLMTTNLNFGETMSQYATWTRTKVVYETKLKNYPLGFNPTLTSRTRRQFCQDVEQALAARGLRIVRPNDDFTIVVPANEVETRLLALLAMAGRARLPVKAPSDETWLNPFGPLTTKAAKNAAAAIGKKAGEKGREGERGQASEGPIPLSPFPPGSLSQIPLRSDIAPDQHLTVALDSPTVGQALGVYAELTGRKLVPNTNSIAERVDDLLNGKLSQLKLITRGATPDSGVRFHNDGMFTAGEVKEAIEAQLKTNGLAVVAVGDKAFRIEQGGKGEGQKGSDAGAVSPAPFLPGSLSAEKAWLAKHEKPLALLYTYSLIIAIVCGTAGLPHILVRFYTNPDGTAAKKTTMWVMILIGVFYIFPPVFGALGRNLLPELYSGVGAKGTDKIVLELPRILNAKYPPLGSILSGITCAGAFAAFMSTFSGLLVSMTGALAHDVYGRILKPKSTSEQRMRMFKIGAVILGGVAIVLGSFVEKLEINFMVGQAFAIAASSYFPLLFMAVWWRKLTMKGAAAGMLAGGMLAVIAISLTSFSTLAAGTDKTAEMFAMFKPLNDFWAEHPLARILCEQPAIWAVPLAITLMILVSKLTRREVPSDIRMKMLVLHAPEQLGLKQEYIQEHQPH